MYLIDKKLHLIDYIFFMSILGRAICIKKVIFLTNKLNMSGMSIL